MAVTQELLPRWSELSDGWSLKKYAGLRYRGDHTG
jgi:hypothetical protein